MREISQKEIDKIANDRVLKMLELSLKQFHVYQNPK